LYWHHDDSPLTQTSSLSFVDEGFVYRMHAGEVTVSASDGSPSASPGGISRAAEMRPATFLPLAERQAALVWRLSESVPASLLAARIHGVWIQAWAVWGATAVWAGVFLFGMARSRKKQLLLDAERLRLLAEVQGLSHRLMSLREGDERKLAVSLHDEVGQALAAVQMRLSVLAQDCARDACDAATKVSQEAAYIGQAMDVLRGHLRALRPPQLDVLGLGEALRALAEAVRGRCGWQLDQEIGSGLERLDEAVSLGAYRLVKEALQNVARHASASCVRLQIYIEQDELLILIEDDGIGFDSGLACAGFGLISMRERAALLGGEMQMDTAPGKGTRLSFLLPLDAPAGL
ncbi:MAG: sensor histidine kinase, partial [Mariprofundaceae bacterium]|nr:sensor histidine kinase [Mariprofundaceae bacterium]